LLFTFALVLALACARSAPAPDAHDGSSGVPAPRADGRLPTLARPTHYALDLVVDPAKERFSGRARIAVAVAEPTSAIVLNARGLTVRSAVLVAAGARLPARTEMRRAAGSKQDPEELVLALDRTIATGPAEIEIDYEAPFAPGLRGLYRVADGGRWYAFTQFEPTDARLAFPCFDEPGYKTPFAVTVSAPQGLLAVANTREVRRSESGGLVRFEFEESPPLPTYLVAIAVGAFDARSGPAGALPVRLLADAGKAGLGDLALAAGRGELVELERYFGRAYPYSKLDLLAVPSFGAGAMENAGLITFREERLLLGDHPSLATRVGMDSVIAHEEAHQWFGDLVTMAWWNDIWLNEAFASFMADEIVDAWRPGTGARVEALALKSRVMGEDSLATARRIRQPVRSTSEAMEAFDGVTYEKGRAVLAMVQAWLGPDRFRDGLRRYLQSHEWGNANADDLYAALAEASGRDVAAVMRSFTDQTGVPLVEARSICTPGQAPAVQLRQREYRTLDRAAKDAGGLWRIPVCILVGGGSYASSNPRCLVLAERENNLVLEGRTHCPTFIYANAGESGYYHVGMGQAELAALTPAIKRLPERERFGIVSNAWAAVRAGDLPVSAFLDLLARFRSERSRLVWTEMIESLRAIDRTFVSAEMRPDFTRFVRALCTPTARKLGWRSAERQPDDERFLREAVLTALGDLGEDGPTLAGAARRARAWLDSPSKGDPDLALIALPLAAKRGDAAFFDRLVGIYTHAPTPEDRVLAVTSLGDFDDPAMIQRTLGLALDGTIKPQDLRYLFPAMGLRPAARDLVQAWIEKHFDALARTFPSFLIGRLVRALPAVCDSTRVRAADAFLRPRAAQLEGVEKDLRQSVEEGLRCAALAEAGRAAAARRLHGGL
jgi:alanyl aminopeptidase